MTTSKYYSKLLDTALDIGERRTSKLQTHPRLQDLYGLTGIRVKHFLNSLLSNGKLTYVELGVHRGGSLVPALWGNPEINAYGVDDWHYSPIDHPSIKLDDEGKTIPWENVKNAAELAIANYKITNVKLISKNWLELKKSDIPEPVDIMHIQPIPAVTNEQLTAILNSIYPLLATTSIIVADYYREDRIQKTYANWIKAKNLNLEYLSIKQSDNLANGQHWWGGIGAMVVSKMEVKK